MFARHKILPCSTSKSPALSSKPISLHLRLHRRLEPLKHAGGGIPAGHGLTRTDGAVYQRLRIITRSAPMSTNVKTNSGPSAPPPPPPGFPAAAAVTVSVAGSLVTLPTSLVTSTK